VFLFAVSFRILEWVDIVHFFFLAVNKFTVAIKNTVHASVDCYCCQD